MGITEANASAKTPKNLSSQEQNPTTSSAPTVVYPDWSGFQAYSPIPPHGFFPSPVSSSPQAHPYMWGAQHLIPPYGAPHPYVMYPHGGLYAHPSMPPGPHTFSPYFIPSANGTAEVSSPAPSAVEVDGKSSEGKEKSATKKMKRSLGSLNMITGRTSNEHVMTSVGASANGDYSQSGESAQSGSEDSSEGSDANSQNGSQPRTYGGHDSSEAERTQNGSGQIAISHTTSQATLNQTMPAIPIQVAGAPGVVAGPTTNLNIGMDFWGTPAPSSVTPVRRKASSTAVVGVLVAGGMGGARENAPSDLWLQGERELKRQKRKQSNRESARRSRMRRQAECEELSHRVEALKEENETLKAEVNRTLKEHEQLLSQNVSFKERLGFNLSGTDNEKPVTFDENSHDDNRQRPLDLDVQEREDHTVQNGH